MRAVWEGDVTIIEDVAKFKIILENVHTWAMRVFRPLIGSHIDAWKYVHLDQNNSTPAALKRRDEIIHHHQSSIPELLEHLDNLGITGLDQRAHQSTSPLLLGMLFQMIQKLERSSLVEQLTGVINERMDRLEAALEISSKSSQLTPISRGKTREASEDQHIYSNHSSENGEVDEAQSRHSSHSSDVGEDETVRYSQLTVDDDPADSDYVGSQTSSQRSSRVGDIESPTQADRNTPTTRLRTQSTPTSITATTPSKNETRPYATSAQSAPPIRVNLPGQERPILIRPRSRSQLDTNTAGSPQASLARGTKDSSSSGLANKAVFKLRESASLTTPSKDPVQFGPNFFSFETTPAANSAAGTKSDNIFGKFLHD
jgi:hypothetical protein